MRCGCIYLKKENRRMSFHAPNQFRVRIGKFGSNDSYGNMGAFSINRAGRKFTIIASDELGWQHVSVSLKDRCPSWNEMCWIKDLFWDKDDAVFQLHPPEYVNFHPNCLHLWRSTTEELKLPPSYMVGFKD